MAEQVSSVVEQIKTVAAGKTDAGLKYADAVRAKLVILNGSISSKEDLFLFLSSLNFLNAYVKRKDAPPDFKKRYFFKAFVAKGVNEMINQNMPDASFCIEKGALYCSIDGLIFSFHDADASELMLQAKKDAHPNYVFQEWQGLRLQPIAGTIFNAAKTLNISEQNAIILSSIKDDLTPPPFEVKYKNKQQFNGNNFNKKKNKHHRKITVSSEPTI